MKNQNLLDFQVAIAEIIRLRTLLNERNLKSIDKYDLLCVLRSPQSGRDISIGRKGRGALLGIARRVLKENVDLKNRISEEEAYKAISAEFIAHICGNSKELNSLLTKEIISSALGAMRTKILKGTTYFFPCVIADDCIESKFNIGPVIFQKVAVFLAERKNQFDEHTNKTVEEWRRAKASNTRTFKDAWPLLSIKKEAAYFSEKAIDILSTYKWVASVEIHDFDSRMGEKVAAACIETALNVMRLFIGEYHAERIRVGGGFRLEQESLRLTQNVRQEFLISLSRTGENAPLGKDWVEKRLKGKAEPWVECAGSLIDALRSGLDLPILYRRLITALWWYGEGVAEPHDHAKVIRYATAIESFLATPLKTGVDGKFTESIGDQLSRRVSFLLADNGKENQEISEEVKKFYDVRSRLVHGQYAPFDGVASRFSYKGEQLARRILMEGLGWTLHVARMDYKMPIAEVSRCFDFELPKLRGIDIEIS